MRRVLFEVRGVPIYSYPAFLYVGLVFGSAAGTWVANAAQLPSARIFAATIVLLIPALLGARLLCVASHWELYRRDLRRIWRRSEGGFSMYGGLPFAVLASTVVLPALDLHFGAFWDVASVTILTGMFFTRFGCLLNGCCAGRPTRGPVGLDLTNARGIRCRRVPTQLLEAGWSLGLLGGALLLLERLPFRGALFLYLLAGYGTGRFFLETLREQQEKVGSLALHRAISASLVLLALAVGLAAGPD
jgi:prolipoprotein diacylglyceryltransferase